MRYDSKSIAESAPMRSAGLLAFLFLFIPATPAFSWIQDDSKRPSNDQAAGKSASEKETTRLADLAWIAGHWQGEAMGGSFEETWNPPSANSMMGMFKFVKDEQVVFYELLTIVEVEGALLLRLKHFDKSLVGWEEKKESVEFPLQKTTKTAAVFDGLTFHRIDANRMRILVVQKRGDQVGELIFDCRRATSVKPKLEEAVNQNP